MPSALLLPQVADQERADLAALFLTDVVQDIVGFMREYNLTLLSYEYFTDIFGVIHFFLSFEMQGEAPVPPSIHPSLSNVGAEAVRGFGMRSGFLTDRRRRRFCFLIDVGGGFHRRGIMRVKGEKSTFRR